MFSLFDELPPLTDAQVAALAKPGESWEEARHRARRLQLCVTECEPCPRCNWSGVERFGGWIQDDGTGCAWCARAERAFPARVVY